MKPTFRNADYWRNPNTEQETHDYSVMKKEFKGAIEDVEGVHSKLLISDIQGVHIPRIFAENFDLSVWNISDRDNDLTCLKDGPKNSWYWEAWNSIMDKAFMIDEYGYRWHLEQDGDLFARLHLEYQGEEDDE